MQSLRLLYRPLLSQLDLFWRFGEPRERRLVGPGLPPLTRLSGIVRHVLHEVLAVVQVERLGLADRVDFVGAAGDELHEVGASFR